MAIYMWRDGWEWQPGPNTIVYYPLDSINTVDDLSGNNHTLTNVNSDIVFGTYQGIDCAKFDKTNNYYNKFVISSGNILPTTTFTWTAWLYAEYSGNFGANPRIFTSYSTSDGVLFGNDADGLIFWGKTGQMPITNYKNAWHLYTITGDFSGFNATGYIDGVQQATFSGSGYTPQNGLQIGGTDGGGGNSSGGDKYNGGMSEVICENIIWTPQEVADYFDFTKANYGF